MISTFIEELLFREIGLECTSVGQATIEAAVRCRMAECGIKSDEDYWKLLTSSTNELDLLIDEVTVPETWFFRDKQPFNFLMRYINARWSWEKRDKPFRILSVPCSTGEEPYSIAISCLEAGLNEQQICVDAFDINRHSLAKAQNGIYGKNSFRDSVFQKFIHYFQMMSEDKYAVRNNVLRVVNFYRDNVLRCGFSAGRRPYDVIFCRNLLIYMADDARRTILNTLSTLLKKDGLLFVGHAEALPIVDEVFHPLKETGAFAYCNSKSNHCDKGKANFIFDLPNAKNGFLTSRAFSPAIGNLLSKRNFSPPVCDERTLGDDPSLTEAELMAKNGQLTAAEALCHEFIENNPLSAKAFFILGLIAQTKGDLTLAEDHLQKVIYLNPEHEQALLHLAFIYDSQGDFDKANNIRTRKKHLKEKYL